MAPGKKVLNRLQWLLLVITVVLSLSGCNGGGSQSSAASSGGSGSPAPGPTGVVISGSVGDGPVTGATVTVYAADGSVVGTLTSDSTASFGGTLVVAADQYPLRLVASGGIDLVTGSAPDFTMTSVMLSPVQTEVNINPFSTLIEMLAGNMPGGVTANNVNAALPIVLGELGFGLDTTAVPDPIATPITAGNVAVLVKASEALGEAIRRTRDQLAASGRQASGDSVLSALAADLTDGVVDGAGAAAADPVVAAVSSVVSGQVLVEALSNNLRVGGVIATPVIDQSIVSTRGGSVTPPLTDSVLVTAQMIQQAQVALAAIQVIDSGTAVSGIATTVGGLAAGSTAATVNTVLPADSSSALDPAVSYVATASTSETTNINQVVAAGGVTSTQPPANTAPVISGTPVAAVTAGSPWSFQPAASDADGDPLSFTVSGKPSWATFNTATGKLSGTPSTGNVGTYSNIVISVSDGTATTSLAAFTVTVNAAPVTTGTMTLTWVAPVARADGTPLSLADIGGYKVYYGTTSGSYPNVYDVPNGTATSATISNVVTGTWYVAMTTYDASGLESSKSTEVVKSIP